VTRAFVWIVLLGILAAVVAGGTAMVARLSDGPIAMFPGGPLVAGEWVRDPVVNWSFAADESTIEMQLLEGDGLARTTWILVVDGEAYIPVTLGFPPGKRWHEGAAPSASAIVRFGGRRYPVTLSKVTDAEQLERMNTANSEKYPPAPGSSQGSWYFRLDHRDAADPTLRF
jgi:hypothetical protein